MNNGIWLGRSYVDELDHSRKIVPVRDQGKSVLCRVYWKQNWKDVFGGITLLPKKLFGLRDIGFTELKIVE